MLQGTFPWPTNATSLCCGRKADFISLSITFFPMRAMPGMSAADSAASLGMKGFVSDSNVPSCWPDRCFLVQHFLDVPHCVTRIAEILHSVIVDLQL